MGDFAWDMKALAIRRADMGGVGGRKRES